MKVVMRVRRRRREVRMEVMRRKKRKRRRRRSLLILRRLLRRVSDRQLFLWVAHCWGFMRLRFCSIGGRKAT
jgi:hypothetical protein